MKKKAIKSLVALSLIAGAPYLATAQKIGNKANITKSETIEKVIPINGTVSEWTYNDDFVYDGFYLQSNDDKLLVKFPKHLGKELKNSIGKNNIVVNGVVKFSPRGEKEIDFVSINSNGKSIYDIPKEKLATPPTEKFISNSGKVNQIQQNDRGEIVGIILDNKTILRLPKHKASELASLAKVGTSVSFTGMEKPKNSDEASVDDYTIVKCNTITIGEDQYLVR